MGKTEDNIAKLEAEIADLEATASEIKAERDEAIASYKEKMTKVSTRRADAWEELVRERKILAGDDAPPQDLSPDGIESQAKVRMN